MRAEDKVRENRLRRVADRRGLRLHKCRRRDPFAVGYDGYMLVWKDGTPYAGDDRTPYGLDLDAVERWLKKLETS